MYDRGDPIHACAGIRHIPESEKLAIYDLPENPADAEAYMIKVQVLLENGENARAQKAADAGYLATNHLDLLYMQGVAYNALGIYTILAFRAIPFCFRD